MGRKAKLKTLRNRQFPVTITESEQTNNFLINIGEFCYASALKFEDALEIKEFLEEKLKEIPLKKLTEHTFKNWVKRTKDQCPLFDFECLKLELVKDEDSKTIIFLPTVTRFSDILQEKLGNS